MRSSSSSAASSSSSAAAAAGGLARTDSDVELLSPSGVVSRGSKGLEEDVVFLAGVEEALGRVVDVHPQLLRGVARLVRAPWQALIEKFPPPRAAVSSASSASAAAAMNGAAAAGPLPLPLLQRMQKALVHDACARAMRAARTLHTLFGVMESQRSELLAASCVVCSVSGDQRELTYSDTCFPSGEWRAKHTVCLPCASAHVMRLVDDKRCDRVKCPHPDCDAEVDLPFVKRVLSRDQFSAYSDACFQISISDSSRFQRCPKCDSLTEIVSSAVPEPKGAISVTDDSGKPLSIDAFKHYKVHRVRCPPCGAVFCSLCKRVPYHLGFSCEQFETYEKAEHCRYCSESLTDANRDRSVVNSLPVCTNASCQERKATACTHRLGCGHACFGVAGEENHPPCLEEGCEGGDGKVDGGDFCAICYTEELRAAPVAQLSSCSHAYHEHCVTAKISKGRPGARYTAQYLECAQCKVTMDHPSPRVQAVLRPAMDLYRDVSAKALARLKIEQMEKDDKLTNPASQFYQKPLQYALNSFAFYNCFKVRRSDRVCACVRFASARLSRCC